VGSPEIWYIKSWEVQPDKVEEHEQLQEKIWNATVKKFPEVRGKQRYFREKVDSREIRYIVLSGYSEVEKYRVMEKLPEGDPHLAGLFEKFYPLTVPGSGRKQVWVDGVVWEEDKDA